MGHFEPNSMFTPKTFIVNMINYKISVTPKKILQPHFFNLIHQFFFFF